MVESGNITADSYRVLNQKQFIVSGTEFPYEVSTVLYPKWPILTNIAVESAVSFSEQKQYGLPRTFVHAHRLLRGTVPRFK